MQCLDFDACSGLDLYCPYTTGCSLDCDYSSSPCDGANVYLYDPDGSYNESLLDVSCESDDCLMYSNWCSDDEYTSCTVTTAIDLTILNCSSGIDHCQIECDGNETDCTLKYIDGSMATSLTVDCIGGCEGSQIVCPSSGGNCTIDCSDGSCDYSLIQNAAGGSMDIFSLECGKEDCYAVTVELDPGSISQIDIECGSSVECLESMLIDYD